MRISSNIIIVCYYFIVGVRAINTNQQQMQKEFCRVWSNNSWVWAKMQHMITPNYADTLLMEVTSW